jgi:hypothetical protein
MRAFKTSFPIVLGLTISFGFLLGTARGDQAALAPKAGDIIYVDAEAMGSATGVNLTNAYTDQLDALAVAVSGDQIWVAEGSYNPGNDRSDSFNLVPGVAVFGGFDPERGINEFSERDWQEFETTLSGTILSGDDHYHVVMADDTSISITAATIPDGSTIRYGQANGSAPINRGGGFYCDGSSGGDCSPTNIVTTGDQKASLQQGGNTILILI